MLRSTRGALNISPVRSRIFGSNLSIFRVSFKLFQTWGWSWWKFAWFCMGCRLSSWQISLWQPRWIKFQMSYFRKMPSSQILVTVKNSLIETDGRKYHHKTSRYDQRRGEVANISCNSGLINYDTKPTSLAHKTDTSVLISACCETTHSPCRMKIVYILPMS